MKILYFIILLGVFSLTLADEAALVKKVKGSVSIEREGKELSVKVGTKLFEKDTIITESKSSVSLIFKDNTRISVGPNSKLLLEQYLFNPDENQEAFVSNLSRGSIACVTGLISKINPKAFKVKVKTATMGIRGTHFIVKVD
ncbi:hypothetical protein SMGD1_2118 [Sulfurimonas gotlandica GD1]|uniref:FecR protein domain-containing protein n=1 Tax=Sulfurimonas gotlandica (strain DSM 19862 / JCM 16533 / GD1) TaxID=929558 RepID=B6BJC0_SULGG|nr:FecR family protein [Sulfurimonas gotlandica]EDZ63766.1 conserved hypothetical protein [Sulfurimonas gotlandica GD1]EHP30641.1 hypothetical protein SMGD1_2118 [Sulfurimonas gotlandica GD1]